MPASEAVPAAVSTTHEDAPLRVAVIIGSVREGRQGPAVTDWFVGAAAAQAGLELDVIDLAEVNLPLVMPGWGGTPSPETAAALAGVTPRLAAADAFVVVTPEYNHSFPAALKNLLDWHHQQWHAKPVGFVSYGGLGGGLRAVEQLRLIFAELHAVTVRDSVSLHGPWSGLGPDGAPRDAAVTEGAVKGMLGQLTWWGRALRGARTTRPYQG
ncbi:MULTISPECIES: NADPH-dependent FMN reductase [unclassified Kitasatospora]|uniref:NADPH-dependent FMN reductase n=1 Tax=unclassified Kitasatospora TaxID=2633591 RepID=UPI00070F65E4|nr:MULTISPECIES: NAD(P)H-dependent oxidoreductase [unclassified Kitasatospora]KQV15346.1 NADPH-dependent FMN reductase [Kitasatospora sp. Root107]KRB64066.1 NADPH-dependent FMN reductase [Kitasatospora sp. Root187]